MKENYFHRGKFTKFNNSYFRYSKLSKYDIKIGFIAQQQVGQCLLISVRNHHHYIEDNYQEYENQTYLWTWMFQFDQLKA